MHSIINLFIIKAFSRNAEKEENMVETGGCYCFFFEKKVVKCFDQCHTFAQLPPG